MSGGKEKIFDGNGEETSGWEKSEEKKIVKVVWVGYMSTSCKEIF